MKEKNNTVSDNREGAKIMRHSALRVNVEYTCKIPMSERYVALTL